VTRDQIEHDLRQLGLRPGQLVLVHSSLRSIGWVDGGAEAVIDALLSVLGPEGALMLPTFSFLNFQPVFDPRTTPSEMGLISERARQRAGAVRSLHPRHSVTVIGPGAEELTRGHLQAGALGVGSPPDRLAARGGYLLLLGVDHVSNSIVHVAEAHARVPYLGTQRSPGFPEEAVVRLPDSREITVSLMPIPTCSRGFPKLEPVLKQRGLIRYGKIGNAASQLMRAQDVIDTATELLRADPGALLCDHGDCWACDRKRERIVEALRKESQSARSGAPLA
jgi:aminoglycoside 3-N-acetyltransferase